MLIRMSFLFLIMVSDVYAPPPPVANRTFTGHCFPRCTCIIDNRYFGPGERWTDPGDPCSVYECQQNGSMHSIYKGCLFNGECKDISSNWTEKCLSYECIQGQQLPLYKLTRAGCVSKDGHCTMLGEYQTEGCNRLQCQFVNGTLTMNSISMGCKLGIDCKQENSYWSDGCTIHTCTRQNGAAKAIALIQEIMYWPDGEYVLFKPKTGCPVDAPYYWTEGNRTHYTMGQNKFPTEHKLSGQFTSTFFKYEFCTRKSNRAKLVKNQRYNTYWEPGNYCLFRSEGFCPRGFSEGFLQIDDHDSKTHLADLQGSAPDGIYHTDTGFFFCCRNDGNVSDGIVLPTEKSFVLLVGGESTKCQTVKDMTMSIERYTVDGSLFSKHDMNGSLPKLQIENGDITVSVCVYHPPQCGCLDETGIRIELHSEKTIHCIQKKCVSVNGTHTLETIKGGCPIDGQCKGEDSVWSVVIGESCTNQTCRRVTDTNGTWFEVKQMSTGCQDVDTCILPGWEVYRDCVTRQCVQDQLTKTNTWMIIKSDCPWSQTCRPVNSTWQHKCITYKCENIYTETGYQQWNIEPVKYGCNDGAGNCYNVGETVNGTCYEAVCQTNSNRSMVYMDVLKGGCLWKDICKQTNETWQDGCHTFQCQWTNEETGYTAVINASTVCELCRSVCKACEWKGKCYNENERWTEKCIDYKCRVQRQVDEVNWSVETTKLGCRGGSKGRCVTLGNNITDQCVTFECKQWGDTLGLDPVSVGCMFEGKCHLENSTWDDNRRCVTHICKKKPGSNGNYMQISVIDYGCAFNGTCKKVNATWPDGCRKRKCVVTKSINMITRSVAPVSAGCDDEGLCRPVGYKKVSNTCMEYECLFNEELTDSYFTLTAGACRSRDNQCHKVNTTWIDKASDMCLNYECRREPVGFLSKMIRQQCRDADGICRPIGSKGFPATVNGSLNTDCRCIKTFDTKSGIAVKC